MWIYSRYITRNGVKIPPPPGKKVWRFWVDEDKNKEIHEDKHKEDSNAED
jgi:hypothetical protein